MNASAAHTIYFLGIGGIGMSALARYFLQAGKKIHGYDLTPTPLTRQLEQEGMEIHYTEAIDLIPAETDLVIYTPAIPADHEELAYLKNKGLPILKRAEVIGQLSKTHQTIAVAGTHGKTSICAIAAHLLQSAGIKLTAFVGGIMKNYGTNLVTGPETEILLVEADEYDRSFLQIEPNMAVISSMDADHLDIYGDIREMERNFRQFAERLPTEGSLIFHENLSVLTSIKRKLSTYGMSRQADYRAENLAVKSGRFHFDLAWKDFKVPDIRMEIPGRHYVENALAAAAIALDLGLNARQMKSGLESFHGVERRFDIRLETDQLVYIDDYAHHPREIEATLNGVRELFPGRKVTGIFQPHLYSRTRDHAEEFAQSLEVLDTIILMDIYPAREKPIPGISSHNILKRIASRKKYLMDREELMSFLENSDTDVLVTLGAGDIGMLADDIQNMLEKK